MNETSSVPTPRALQSSPSPQDPSERVRTGSAADRDWHFGDITDSLAFMAWEWIGEGHRCPVYWPVAHLESPTRCELREGHPIVHFRADNSV